MIKIIAINENQMATYGLSLFWGHFRILLTFSLIVGTHITLEIGLWRIAWQTGMGYYQK
jgi:hypothetical protein